MMDEPLEVRVAEGPEGFSELLLSGVSLREIAYIFRARFRHGYMICFDVDTGAVLLDDFAENLEAEGLLCEQLDEDGRVHLLRTDSFDIVADLKPFRLSLLFIDGPLTAEDYRRVGGQRDCYPHDLDTLRRLGGHMYLYWRADRFLMVAGRDEWFPRDLLEYFFEKSFLDNERMLRPDELDKLMASLLPTIAETGLLVSPPVEGDVRSPVHAIAWTAPGTLGNTRATLNRAVPCFRICRDGPRLEVVAVDAVRLYQFFGLTNYLTIWFRSLKPTLGPVFVGLVVFCLIQLLGPTSQQSSSPVLEMLLLVLLLYLFNSRRD